MTECPICHGKRLLPFVKNGKVVPNAFVDCDNCKQSEQGHYREIMPADFDFPCSDTFRGYYQQKYGTRTDRAFEQSNAALYDQVQSLERDRQVSARPGPADLTPLRVALADLNNKVSHHIDAGKKKQIQQKTDGIEL